MLLAIHLAVTALFLPLGVPFSKGKGAWLIAGYNTSSPAEKEKIDEKLLCGFVGKLIFALAVCRLAVAANDTLRSMALLWVGLALFAVTVIAGVIYADAGNRFPKG